MEVSLVGSGAWVKKQGRLNEPALFERRLGCFRKAYAGWEQICLSLCVERLYLCAVWAATVWRTRRFYLLQSPAWAGWSKGGTGPLRAIFRAQWPAAPFVGSGRRCRWSAAYVLCHLPGRLRYGLVSPFYGAAEFTPYVVGFFWKTDGLISGVKDFVQRTEKSLKVVECNCCS